MARRFILPCLESISNACRYILSTSSISISVSKKKKSLLEVEEFKGKHILRAVYVYVP